MHRTVRSALRRAAHLLIAVSALIVAASSSSAHAQSPEHDAAYRTVTRLFDAMRARDTLAMRATVTSNASMQSLVSGAVRFESIDGWISSVGRGPTGLVLDERLANPVVHIDGDLASVWVDYWFFAGDRFSHCGVDALLLARLDGAWRVFSIVDTRRTAGCAPAPPKPGP